MYARETLVTDVQIMDEMFKKYHENSKDGLLRCKRVIGGFIDQLKEKFEHLYDEKLLGKFARQYIKYILICPTTYSCHVDLVHFIPSLNLSGTDTEIPDSDIFKSDIRPSLEGHGIFEYILRIFENIWYLVTP